MSAFLRKRWFLLGLTFCIAVGLSLGLNLSSGALDRLTAAFSPRWITAIVLFLMSFSLDGRQLRASFRTPGPVVWATAVNFGMIPLLGWALMHVQTTPDFKYGLMIAASAPCTMAAASVWTRRAGGNDAVSLLVTVLTNGACFLVTPFWLNTTTGGNVQFDTLTMLLRLVNAALIPMAAGQLLRLVPAAARFATRFKTPIGVVAQACILILVFTAAGKAGGQLNANEAGRPGISAVALVWGSCIVVHLAAMWTSLAGSSAFGFPTEDRIATAFAGSQKTLPIAVFVALDPAMFGNPDLLGPGVGLPFVVFPMILYHASQLFIDTFVADRFAASCTQSFDPNGPP